MPVFDIILPTYNNLDELKECLIHLDKQTLKDFKVLVCVDGSTDGTIEYLHNAKFNFLFQIITHPDGKNHGRNPTRNLALPHLSSEYLIMIDSDIKPVEQFVEKHLELLNRKTCISLGDVVYTNTTENVWADYLQTRGKNKFAHLSELPGYYLNTQNIAMRTEDFLNSGGQDGNMTTYGGGDTEFGYRISKTLKLPLIFNKEASGFSEMPKTLDFALKQMEEFGRINLHYIHKKHPEFNSLFRFDLIESSSLKNSLIKILTGKQVVSSAKYLVKYFPPILRRKLIHLLVFSSIYKGYKEKL